MRKNRKPILPIVVLFVVLNGFFIAGRGVLERWGVDQEVLIIGNVLLFGITLISYLVAIKGLNNKPSCICAVGLRKHYDQVIHLHYCSGNLYCYL